MPDIPAAKQITEILAEPTFDAVQKIRKDYLDNRLNTELTAHVIRNFPKRYVESKVSFKGIHKDCQVDIKRVINALFSKDPKMLLLTGDVGVGKSAALWTIWKFVVTGAVCYEYLRILGVTSRDEHERQHQLSQFRVDEFLASQVEFVTHKRFISKLRRYGGDEALHDHLPFQQPFLFIDKLGFGYEDEKGWNLFLQEEFFDDRWLKMWPMFIATNKSVAELREWPGWSPIVDRLGDDSWSIVCNMGEGSRRKV